MSLTVRPTLRDAAQQALEALERADKISGYGNNRKTISALRAALAEDVPETNFGTMAQGVDSPVAYMMVNKAHGHTPSLHFTPPENWHATWEAVPLYAAPPKRKPLTDEEIEDLYFDCFSMGELKAFARAIERAHGIGGEE